MTALLSVHCNLQCKYSCTGSTSNFESNPTRCDLQTSAFTHTGCTSPRRAETGTYRGLAAAWKPHTVHSLCSSGREVGAISVTTDLLKICKDLSRAGQLLFISPASIQRDMSPVSHAWKLHREEMSQESVWKIWLKQSMLASNSQPSPQTHLMPTCAHSDMLSTNWPSSPWMQDLEWWYVLVLECFTKACTRLWHNILWTAGPSLPWAIA